MSTRSYIGIVNGDTAKLSYCHSDGYVSFNGAILVKAYTNENKINELLSYGDMSSLGEKIGTQHGFDFGERPKNTCTFYKRDRGESDVDASTVEKKNLETWINNTDAEFIYLFMNKNWYVSEVEHPLKFELVTDVLAREKQVA